MQLPSFERAGESIFVENVDFQVLNFRVHTCDLSFAEKDWLFFIKLNRK
jgi:hypothetical protein